MFSHVKIRVEFTMYVEKIRWKRGGCKRKGRI
jgi:hypothetical protein